jgi:hypothetical protein
VQGNRFCFPHTSLFLFVEHLVLIVYALECFDITVVLFVVDVTLLSLLFVFSFIFFRRCFNAAAVSVLVWPSWLRED